MLAEHITPRRVVPALATLALLLASCASTPDDGLRAVLHPHVGTGPAAPRPDSVPALLDSRARPLAIINGQPAPVPSIPMGSSAAIDRILDEATRRSRVMDLHADLCANHGPRLTGSTREAAARRWAIDQLRSWGIDNAREEPWGTIATRFDRGPSSIKIFGKHISKDDDGEEKVEWREARAAQFSTLAWTSATPGPVRGRVIKLPATDEQYAAVKDRLPGAWILIEPPPVYGRTGLRQIGYMQRERFEERIKARAAVRDEGADPASFPIETRLIFDGIAGFLSTSRDERVWTTSSPNWRERPAADFPRPPDIEASIRLSDYDYINSRLADGEEFEVEVNLDHAVTPGPITVSNVIADIPGTRFPDEYVIVCGHLDSWDGPGSQGATDNGTGVVTTLEAARLLMAAGARPHRTIRFILWTGEEQGLLGALEYVKQHPELMPRISAVLNDDGGTNTQGGLSCTDAMAPYLAAATAPVNNVFFDSASGKPLNVDITPTGAKFDQSGGSDHKAFIDAGVPGFFWKEVGRAEYGFGWHTQNDTAALAIPEYLMQSAACAAITAYNLACAPDLLPRWKVDEQTPDPPTQPSPGDAPAPPAPGVGAAN